MPQNYTPEFKKKIVRLHEEEGRTYKSITAEYSGRFWTVIPEAQYRDSALMDTAILSIEYRDSGQRIPIFFIMYPYALKRKYITKEVIVYDQVSRDHPAIRIRS